ncbi:unnamed protein product [Nyctereutes procyonoides]|uniref:(raccoon dog) hypothetical protein n=1 Tax=Nyctereutes procyonoides TaxID=34880 RepID=A0A811YEM4_NYCPR|nr:unnamed protein product [Nyctereutes procyonoides]
MAVRPPPPPPPPPRSRSPPPRPGRSRQTAPASTPPAQRPRTRGGRGRGALTVSGADRPDWGPEEEEKEEEEKEEHGKLHSGDGGGSHCGAAAELWEGGGGALVDPPRCLMGRLRVSLRASGLPFFSPTREAGAGMCRETTSLKEEEGPCSFLCIKIAMSRNRLQSHVYVLSPFLSLSSKAVLGY